MPSCPPGTVQVGAITVHGPDGDQTCVICESCELPETCQPPFPGPYRFVARGTYTAGIEPSTGINCAPCVDAVRWAFGGSFLKLSSFVSASFSCPGGCGLTVRSYAIRYKAYLFNLEDPPSFVQINDSFGFSADYVFKSVDVYIVPQSSACLPDPVTGIPAGCTDVFYLGTYDSDCPRICS